MSKTTPDQVIAHVELLRAVDRLLTDADTVREKREAIHRLFQAEQATSGEKQGASR